MSVGYDCRPGEVIKVDGQNWRVDSTFPNRILARNMNDEARWFDYSELSAKNATYVAILQILPMEVQ